MSEVNNVKKKTIRNLTEDFLTVMHNNSESYTKSLFSMLSILLEVNKDYGNRINTLEINFSQLFDENKNFKNDINKVKLLQDERESLLIDNVVDKVNLRFKSNQNSNVKVNEIYNNFDNMLYDKRSVYNKKSKLSSSNDIKPIEEETKSAVKQKFSTKSNIKVLQPEENEERLGIKEDNDNSSLKDSPIIPNIEANEYKDLENNIIDIKTIDNNEVNNKSTFKPSLKKDSSLNEKSQKQIQIVDMLNKIPEPIFKIEEIDKIFKSIAGVLETGIFVLDRKNTRLFVNFEERYP